MLSFQSLVKVEKSSVLSFAEYPFSIILLVLKIAFNYAEPFFGEYVSSKKLSCFLSVAVPFN